MNPERFSVDSDSLSSSHLPSVDLRPQLEAWCKVSLSVRHRSGVALGLMAQERNRNWLESATTVGQLLEPCSFELTGLTPTALTCV